MQRKPLRQYCELDSNSKEDQFLAIGTHRSLDKVSEKKLLDEVVVKKVEVRV